jgi:NADH-quinone oxidoreductase subunit N
MELAQSTAWDGIAVGEHLFAFSPMIALTLTMLAVVACPLLIGRGARTIGTVVVLGVVAALFLCFRVGAVVADGGFSGLSTSPAAGILLVDNLSIGFQTLLFVFMLGVITLWWVGSSETERNAPEFFILLVGSALGMALMSSTANLLMMVLAMETASLPSYALVGFDKTNRRSAEASLKYMIFGAVSAAIMLYGISLIYGLVGSLSVPAIATYTIEQFIGGQNTLLLSVGLLCIFAGIAFKVSAVPFHFWCPDAFEGAKIEVTTWLSVVSKAAGLVMLVRVLTFFSSAVPEVHAMSILNPIIWTIAIVAMVTMTFGNFAAYRQESVKRMLAYSSIAHAGYMLSAAAVLLHPSVAGSESPISALLGYIVVYLFMNLGAFGTVAMVGWDTGSDRLETFTGLIRRAPFLAVPMVMCLMSLVGLPIFAGFVAKWWVLVSLGKMGGTIGWVLAVVVVSNTLFSLYYYMRIVVKMTLKDDDQSPVRASPVGIGLVNACAIVLMILFFGANPFRQITDRYSKNLVTAATLSSTRTTTVVDATTPTDAATPTAGDSH